MKKSIFLFITVIIFSINCLFSQSVPKYHVGQKVEIYNIKWYPGYIISIGTGNYSGDYYVHYDGFSDASNQYISERNIQLPTVNKPDNYKDGPRNGRYIILSYGSVTNPITGGFLDLNNGSYQYLNGAKKVTGQGNYKYDPANKKVFWLSGPLTQFGKSSGFEIDREGKTHKLRLMNATIASNSTDSK